MQNRVYKLSVWGQEFSLRLFKTSYSYGENLAIVAHTTDGAPFATLTVNLMSPEQSKERAYVDTNNCPWIEEFIVQNNLGKPVPGYYQVSGYCIYPLYEFDLSKLSTLY